MVGARSYRNPLDLVEADLVGGAIVEFGRPRRLVGRDLLGVLQRAAVLEVGGDAVSTCGRVVAFLPLKAYACYLRPEGGIG